MEKPVEQPKQPGPITWVLMHNQLLTIALMRLTNWLSMTNSHLENDEFGKTTREFTREALLSAPALTAAPGIGHLSE